MRHERVQIHPLGNIGDELPILVCVTELGQVPAIAVCGDAGCASTKEQDAISGSSLSEETVAGRDSGA